MSKSSASNKVVAGTFVSSAIGAGLLASCCGVPLLLGAIGLGSGGLSLFFTGVRVPLFLVCLASMLGSAGYLVWRRSRCEDDCAPTKMRRTQLLLLGGAVCSVVVAAAAVYLPQPPAQAMAATAVQGAAEANTSGRLSEIEIPVSGMACASCAAPIRAALAQIAPVEKFQVDIQHGLVRFSVPEERANIVEFRHAIERLGYTTANARIAAINPS